ncbi:MAG TPA: zf-HC2 domain-containing protein [Blastocatellia bacterium]|nr:zf-HC2 domain-containing protein [Blastocatellia bacterium]
MRCSRAKRLLQAGLDHELDDLVREELAAHIDSCKACAGGLLLLRRLGSVLDEAPQIDVPAGFSLSVLDRATDRDGRSAEFTLQPAPRMLTWFRSLGLMGRMVTAAILAIAVVGGVEASRAVMPVVTGTPSTALPESSAELEVNQLERAMFDLVANETNGRSGREQRRQGGRP